MGENNWHNAYEKIKNFCKKLGGLLATPADVGATHEEKLFSITCYISSKLDNRKLADAIAELEHMWNELKTLLHPRGKIEIVEITADRERTVEIEPATNTIKVHINYTKEYNIDMPATLDIASHSYISEYVDDKTAYIHIQTWNTKTATWVTGTMTIRNSIDKHRLEQLLEKLDRMVESISENTRKTLQNLREKLAQTL